MEKIRVAVLGATGMVGQYFLHLLRDHPDFEVAAVCASEARIGQPLMEARALHPAGIPAQMAHLHFSALDAKSLADLGVDIAFSGLPADIARNIEMELTLRGIHVFSNASSYRMDALVPILIPEINASHLALVSQQLQQRKGFIITNANCTTTGLAISLLPLLPLGIKRLIVASYQAVSGAGYPGIPAMDISGNVIPYIDGEEPKVRKECGKIFGRVGPAGLEPAQWQVYAHCIRVPTLVGHLVSTHVELAEALTLEQVTGLFRDYQSPVEVAGLPTAPLKPIILATDRNRPQPMRDADAGEPARAAGMAVTVGRLEVEGNIVRYVNLANNLVRGAAGGSVLNAELCLRQGLIGRQS